jgi:hypothetical protein
VLCREIGEIEYAYVESFRTFRQDFGYRNLDPRLEKSVAALSAWYAEEEARRPQIERLFNFPRDSPIGSSPQ